MKRKKEKDECLELLWSMRERGGGSFAEFKRAMGNEFCEEDIDELEREKSITLDRDRGAIALTESGSAVAKDIIRAHRIAERLMRDVLGGDFEPGACEFEHMVNPALVDSICTLLGHPRECPHGKPIPEGACCRRCDKSASSSIMPLTELAIGQSAKVAYVQCANDRQMHRIDGLQIRPGATVKLHQNFPTIVIECEGASIALDDTVAANIRVWACGNKDDTAKQEKPRRFGGFGFRRRKCHGGGDGE